MGRILHFTAERPSLEVNGEQLSNCEHASQIVDSELYTVAFCKLQVSVQGFWADASSLRSCPELARCKQLLENHANVLM